MKDFHTSLPNLLKYSDYRKYLGDVYLRAKTLDSRFSYRYLSAQAGIRSSSFLKYVIEGKRNLSRQSLLKIAGALKLADREAEYLEALMHFNQARSMKEKNTWFARIITLRGAHENKALNPKQLDLFAEWRHTAIRELLNCTGGRANPELLAKAIRPQVTLSEIEESLRILLELGLVQVDEAGLLHPMDAVIATGPKHASKTVANYQMVMLKLAQEAFGRWSQDDRLMSATTFSISEMGVDLFRRKLRECRSELMELARHDEKPERVWHLNLSFFPLSLPVKP